MYYGEQMSNKVVATILLIGMLLLTLGVFRTIGAVNTDPVPTTIQGNK